MSNARLQSMYTETLRASLKKELAIDNVNAVPKLEKIVINMGAGDFTQDKKIVQEVTELLSKIAGQSAIVTKARKSVAGFKIREGWPIGAKVTLRGKRMYEFLDRLVSISLPRTRDFRGLSTKAFDGRGNYTLGLKDFTIFPEVEFDKVKRVRGMDITFVTTAKDNAQARALLKAFKFPFKETREA